MRERLAVLPVNIFQSSWFKLVVFFGAALYSLLRLFYCLYSFSSKIGLSLLLMRSISIGFPWLITKKKLRFLTTLGYFGRFLAISALVLQNDWIKSSHLFRDISSFEFLPLKTIVNILLFILHSEWIFNWTQFTNFCSALFLCNIFRYLNFVRFCS